MFWYYFLKGFYHSSIITFLVLLFLEYNRLNIYYLGSNSHILLNNIGLQVIGMQIFAILIIIVNLQIFTFQYKTGFLSILFIWGQSLLYFVCLYVFGLKKNFECFDYLYKIGANPNFYLCLISVLMLCFLIEMAYLKYQGSFYPLFQSLMISRMLMNSMVNTSSKFLVNLATMTLILISNRNKVYQTTNDYINDPIE